MAFDYVNAETGEILGILSSRRNYDIKNHFKTRYSRTELDQVETITIDMNSAYMAVIKEVFPKAFIIIDRFHIVQLITRSFNKARVKYMNQLKSSNEDQKKYRRLKRYWKVFLIPRVRLSYCEYKLYSLFGQRTQAGILEEMLAYDDSFRADYELFQSISEAIQTNDADRLKDILTEPNNTASASLKTSMSTLLKHLDYIKNTFAYPYTNARIEGNHNKIKVLNRIAFGFRNYGNYIDRIVLYFNNKKGARTDSQKQKIAA